MKSASTRDFDTVRIREQQILRRGCTYVQPRQSPRCPYTQSMDGNKGSVQNLDLWLCRIRHWGLLERPPGASVLPSSLINNALISPNP